MPVVLLAVAAVILGGVVAVARGRGGELAEFASDQPSFDPDLATAADVAMLRPPSALWGYSVQATDEALSRIAQAVTERDVEIATLRRQLEELTSASAADQAVTTMQSPPPGQLPAPGQFPMPDQFQAPGQVSSGQVPPSGWAGELRPAASLYPRAGLWPVNSAPQVAPWPAEAAPNEELWPVGPRPRAGPGVASGPVGAGPGVAGGEGPGDALAPTRGPRAAGGPRPAGDGSQPLSDSLEAGDDK